MYVLALLTQLRYIYPKSYTGTLQVYNLNNSGTMYIF